MLNKRKPVVIDLFAGCGGLSLGLEEAGFYPIFVNELHHDAMATYLVNRMTSNPLLVKYQEFDVKNMVLENTFLDDLKSGFKKDYGRDTSKGEVDLVVGGPPCQGYSGIGHRRSYSVDKKQLPSNHLYEDMAYVVNSIRPKIFLFENVRGLLSVPLKHVPHRKRNGKLKTIEEKGGTLQYILNYLKKCGYKVSFNLYNSANFGTPQIRERVIIVGNKKEKLPYLTPTHSENGEYSLKPWKTFKFATKGLHNLKHDHVNFPKYRLKYYRKLKEGQNWKNLSKSLQKEALGNSYYAGGGKTGFLRRLAWNKPSPTLVTDPTMPATDLAHPELDRPLSIQEYKRLQEFPDDWKLSGNLRYQYKQIGNAVPVSLGRAIGKLIVNNIKKKKMKIINNFRYSRYLNTSDLDWQKGLNNKIISNQRSFNF